MKIKIEYVSGQSSYPREIFEGQFISVSDEAKEVTKIISIIVKDGYYSSDEFVYIECEKRDLRDNIISEIIRSNPKIDIVSRKNEAGGDFGFNVFVNCEETKEELTQKRNKLNREISILKKANLKQ